MDIELSILFLSQMLYHMINIYNIETGETDIEEANLRGLDSLIETLDLEVAEDYDIFQERLFTHLTKLSQE